MLTKKQFLLVVIVLVCGIVMVHGLSYLRGEMVVIDATFKNIPHRIGDWVGEDHRFDDSIYEELRADENLFRLYKNSQGDELGFYIGYYGTQRGGHPEHIPAGCYTGAGWGIESNTPLEITALDGSKTITVNNFYARKGEETEQTIHWLQNFRGTVMHDGFGQNFEKIYTKLFFNRNDGAFIRINARVKNSRQETLAYEIDFIQNVLPYLEKHWPVEAVQ